IPAGTAQGFTAVGTFSDNSTQNLASVAWSSSNSAIAAISNDASDHGVAEGIAVGSTTIGTCTGAICGSTSLTVVPADPDIASLAPVSGPVGSTVSIVGSGFGSIQGSNAVSVDGVAASVTIWSPASIAFMVPSGATTGNVAVTVGSVASNIAQFTVLPTPIISSVSPSSGDVGATVQVSGSNFGDAQGTSTATLNGTPIPISMWSATSVAGTVPTGATTGNLVVSVSGVASNSVSFTITSVPAIFSLSPPLGPA